MQFAIVIMAAGKGTRLKSKRPKVLHEVGGKPLIRHVVDAARQIVPPEDVYVIVGHEAALVKDSVSCAGGAIHRAKGAARHRPCHANGTPGDPGV